MLLNTSCNANALAKIWPRTFYSDPYTLNPFYSALQEVGIDPSYIPTGKKYPNGNPITICGSVLLSDLIIAHFKGSKPSGWVHPIPLEGTKNLPVSAGERRVLRECKRINRKRK